jgi:hypothetical protein
MLCWLRASLPSAASLGRGDPAIRVNRACGGSARLRRSTAPRKGRRWSNGWHRLGVLPRTTGCKLPNHRYRFLGPCCSSAAAAGPAGRQKGPPLIARWLKFRRLVSPSLLRLSLSGSFASMALPDRCHPWHPRHQCRAVLGTVVGLSLAATLFGSACRAMSCEIPPAGRPSLSG